MIRTKKRLSEVNKLREELANLSYVIKGGFATNGVANDIKQLDRVITDLRKRTSTLEEIIRESGIITDFDADEVKIREDRSQDIFGGVHVKSTAYQINQVKVL